MNWLKQNWFKIAILMILLLFFGAYLYYTYIYIPKKEEFNRSEEYKERYAKTMVQEYLLDGCLKSAEEEYYSYLKINGTEKPDGTIWAEDRFSDRAEKNRKEKKDGCYKRYPLN